MTKEEITDLYSEEIPEQEEDKQEEDDILDFNLEELIVEGKNAVIERVIEFFNIETHKIQKMRIYVTPLPYSEIQSMERAIARDKKKIKDIRMMACTKAWVEPDGMPIEQSKIRQMAEGIPKAVYEEIKIVSGRIHDASEDKLIEKMAGF